VHYDHILPYQESSTTTPWTYHTIHTQNLDIHPNLDENNSNTTIPSPDMNTNPANFHPDSSNITSDSLPVLQDSLPAPQATDNIESSSENEPVEPSHDLTDDTNNTIPQAPSDITHPPTQTIRKSTRVSVKPKHLADFLCNLSQSSPEPSSTGILYPITDYHSYANISKSLSEFSQAIVTDTEPKS
jgi:hypothetical protein